VGVPHVLEDVAAPVDHAGLGREIGEQVELLGGERDLLAGQPRPPGLR
jgi:hypothetical protein